jgi:hypothetical protein
VPKSSGGRVLLGRRLAVLQLVSLECAVRVFYFLLLLSEPAQCARLSFILEPPD